MLLVLLLSVGVAHSCDIEINSSLVVCTDLTAFRLFNDSETSLRTLHLEQCTTSSDVVSSTAIETVDIQCNDSLPLFALENFSRLSNIVLSECSLTFLQWQSLYVYDQTPRADISACPLNCSCSNEWITSTRTDSAFSVIPILPRGYRCSFSHCIWGTLAAPPYIECAPGDTVTLDVNISASMVDVFSSRKYFSWQMSRSDHSFVEHITRNHMKLVIDTVTEKQLGTIAAICWHCEHPLMATVEILRSFSKRWSGETSPEQRFEFAISGLACLFSSTLNAGKEISETNSSVFAAAGTRVLV